MQIEQKIPFDEIVQGASVRVVTINGLQYLSIRDIIICVCGKDPNYSGQIWRNLSQNQKNEVREFLMNHKFTGSGQSEQPVITFPGALKLMMFLPGDTAKKHRSAMVTILTRYFTGDKSLIQEIEANAVSQLPVCRLAQSHICDAKYVAICSSNAMFSLPYFKTNGKFKTTF